MLGEWPYKRDGLLWEWSYKRGSLWWEWSYKRGGLWWEWSYRRGTTVLLVICVIHAHISMVFLLQIKMNAKLTMEIVNRIVQIMKEVTVVPVRQDINCQLTMCHVIVSMSADRVSCDCKYMYIKWLKLDPLNQTLTHFEKQTGR
jgi:hypothetical protein